MSGIIFFPGSPLVPSRPPSLSTSSLMIVASRPQSCESCMQKMAAKRICDRSPWMRRTIARSDGVSVVLGQTAGLAAMMSCGIHALVRPYLQSFSCQCAAQSFPKRDAAHDSATRRHSSPLPPMTRTGLSAYCLAYACIGVWLCTSWLAVSYRRLVSYQHVS